MSDSLINIDKRCIFRETFDSEQAVRRNNGVPNNVTFNNGVAGFNGSSSYLDLKSIPIGTNTLRFKFKSLAPIAGKILFEGRKSGGDTNLVYYSGATTLFSGSGTKYINGIASSTVDTATKEIIISGFITKYNTARLFGDLALSAVFGTGEIELFEIYSGTLTAEEVKTLNENKRYKNINVDHEEQLGPELVDQNNWYTTAWWTANPVGFVQNGTTLQTPGQATGNITKLNVLTTGKLYRVTYTANIISGNVGVGSYDGAAARVPSSGTGIKTFSDIILSTGPTLDIYCWAFNGSVTALSIKELTVRYTKEILNVSAFDGTIRNKYSGDPYGPNLITNSGFTSDWVDTNNDGLADGWSKVYGSEICSIVTGNGFNGNAQRIFATVGGGATSIHNGSKFVQGKSYRLTLRYRCSDVLRIYRSTGAFLLELPTNTGDAKIFTAIITPDNTGNFNFFVPNINQWAEVDDVDLKEIIPSVIVTSCSVSKENNMLAMWFDGINSKINCGTYESMLGDKSIIAWARIKDPRTNTSDSILTNRSLILFYYHVNRKFFFTSNGATYVTSAAVNDTGLHCVCVTRTAAGIANIYVDGVLSSLANQNSGSPIVGSVNLHIGMDETYNKWMGSIPSVRVTDGLLTPAEIAQIYSSEKLKYGL